jgi:hypothetical protein
MDGGSYDWTAFASGFALALLIFVVIRWRRSQQRTDSLATPPRFPPSTRNLSSELRAQILQLKAEGKLIEAIKITRQQTGLDLKASKELVEGLG